MSDPKPAPDQTAEVQQSLTRIAERSAAVMARLLENPPQGDLARDVTDLGIDKAFADLGTKLLADPARLAEAQLRALEDFARLWTATLQRVQGGTSTPVKEPARGDNRFRSESWQENVVFDFIKQSYLIAAEHIQRTVAETRGLDEPTARKVRFFTRQAVDALSPTNFALTNPDVLKATAESGGRNLLSGLEHLLEDLDRGRGRLAIRMTDASAFRMGENVASTPGKVVWQNDLMQLLQFEPSTPRVDRTPLLICPPWINKYYILDLRPSNSFIRWAVEQGMTVFVISWVNPDERLAHKTFDDYLFEGPLAAMDAVRDATGEPAVNLIGYCLGGTLTACLMAWLQARGQADRVRSVTYFTTMIDFREPGDLGAFVDEATVERLEKRMAARGFLEGEEMAGTFNLLRDNDLIWSFVVNNYLLGKDPFPFDLLYWNSDATRMPAKMHTFYLRNMYLANRLAQPGALVVGGERLDLSSVTTPTYFISTQEDHIAPWKSTYAGAHLFGGPVRFVLGGSGHIAGIVNPPAARKYAYWTGTDLAQDPQRWLESATRHDGSWWTDWSAWVSSFAQGKVAARRPGDRALRVIEDAPGTFARLRLDTAGSPEQAPPPASPVAPNAPAGGTATPERPEAATRSHAAGPAPARAPVETPSPTPRKRARPAPKPEPEAAPSTKARRPPRASAASPAPAAPAATRKRSVSAASGPATSQTAGAGKPASRAPGVKAAAGDSQSPAALISALFRDRKAATDTPSAPLGKDKGKPKAKTRKTGKAGRKDR